MKPMSVEQCVSEGLNALLENRSRIVPGRLNRFMDAFVPAFVKPSYLFAGFGASEATIFLKQGSPRSGSQNGRSFNWP